MSALSVSTSASASPRATLSPERLSQRRILPSSIVSESLGIVISLLIDGSPKIRLRQLLRRLYDITGAGQRGMLEMLVVWHRRIERRHAGDRSVERIERGFVNLRGNLRAGAAGAPSFVGDDCAPGFFHRCDHGLHVERVQRPQVDNLGVDAGVLERLGRGDRVVYALRVSDNSHILTLANYICLAERHHELGIFRNFALNTV